MFVTGFRDVRDVAAEQAKVDPMYQFTIEPLAGSGGWEIAGYNIAFTNSALWMPAWVAPNTDNAKAYTA